MDPWKHRLDPKSDIIFKRLFRDKQILIPFLNDTLHLNGLDRIVDVTLLETTKEREHPEDKQMNYAVQRLEEISSDPAVIAEYQRRRKFELDEAAKITRAERLSNEKGKLEGKLENAHHNAIEILNARFGGQGQSLKETILSLTNEETLSKVVVILATAPTFLAAVESIIALSAPPPKPRIRS